MTTVSPPQTEINSLIALYSSGQIQEALDSVGALIKEYPNDPLLYNLSGICYKTIGELDEAVKSFEKALAIKPDYTEVNYNLGLTLQDLGQLDAAVKSYEKAIAIKPDYANACNNLGVTLQELGQLDTAVKSYEQAIAIKPDFVEAYYNLGVTLQELGQLDAAVECYKKALAIKPDYAEAHYNLGNALKDLGQLDAAVKSYEQALAIKPEYANAYFNRGHVLKNLKRLDEALVSYESAIAIKPDIDFILGDLLHTKMHLCIWDDLAHRLHELTKKINNSEKVVIPFALLALIDDPEVQKKTAEIYANENYPQSHVLSKIGRYPKHKKIRIGYFSRDFHNHATMHLMAELFECHDKDCFELIAFSFGPDKQDQWRKRVFLCFDQFVDVRLKSDREVSLLARKMEIDIAIDLKGFTRGCRPNIFAEGCAPIQVSYLGYPGTMAANYMDYLIADHTLISEEKQHHYSEKIVYMPNSYQVNVSKRSVSETSLLRYELGLPNTGFIFCCFNNNYKITPSTFTGWMRILKAVEDSVLWLFENNNNTAKNLKKEAIKFGINEDRLVFATHMPVEDHLNRIKQADLFIDTLPYNAHTTASDALRMGIPVLTCIGSSFASRVAASLLNAVNLPELITTTQEQYESFAIELATKPEKLKIIKDKLVDNLPTAPLYDTLLFTRHLESAYLTMYEKYQQGLDPDHIYVEH
uniref:protein O-GlcNAc transferase n=1 Tax=uncultured marine bacterium 583 TaxID=257403 RepID=Q6SES7_9BACT|nr:TPR repeat protein [uncultured marine bacterium 583]